MSFLSNKARENVTLARYADPAEVAGYVASHDGWGPAARYFRSRLYVVDEVLRERAGGELLDVGCGPGMFVKELIDTRAGDFTITACDLSPAMTAAAAAQAGLSDVVRVLEASIEDMPFDDRDFDVVVALGVLEYVDVDKSLHEIARVLRDDGLLVLTMLNPFSPYRIFEWFVYWPALRLLGRVERLLRGPLGQRHGALKSGIHAMPPGRLRRLMRAEGLVVTDLVYYDVTPLVPPFDGVVRRWTKRWRDRPETTVGDGGVRRLLGTGYLVTARRA